MVRAECFLDISGIVFQGVHCGIMGIQCPNVFVPQMIGTM